MIFRPSGPNWRMSQNHVETRIRFLRSQFSFLRCKYVQLILPADGVFIQITPPFFFVSFAVRHLAIEHCLPDFASITTSTRSNWPSQRQPKSRKSNLFQYMVNSLDLVKFFGAVGPIYRGELLLNFIILITCMQYYIQRSIAW